jgi:hypothetical protein
MAGVVRKKNSHAMGRGTFEIKRIENDKQRQTAFHKRRHGLVKKAMQLSILCDCEVALVGRFSEWTLLMYSGMPGR